MKQRKLTVSRQRNLCDELFGSQKCRGMMLLLLHADGMGKEASLLGSISQIQTTELKVPSSTLSSLLQVEFGGVIAVQQKWRTRHDGANFWIHC